MHSHDDLIQGSAAWHAHRASYFNASDAPAMMGASSYKTRSQLLQELHTGLNAEVSAETQQLFDNGHRFEALARPLAEEIIGEELYPVVGTEGKLSASFDGLTLLENINFEHKSLNKVLREAMFDGCTGADLPLEYQIQMEQQHMVSGAEKTLFMASKWDDQGNLIEERHCWYYPNPELATKIMAGWAQFEQDLCAYTPTAVVAPIAAQAVTALPAVSVQVTGSIAVRDNFATFETALRDFIDHRLIREPKTDQDFADLDLQIKALKGAEIALDAAEAQMLAQVESVDAIKRTKDMLARLTRDNRLMAEKLLAARKEQIKGEIVTGGVVALREHIAALNTRLGKPYMPTIQADFAGAAKNKRTVASLQDAVDTELARAKIEASAIADKIDANLKTLRELASEHAFLFADAATIVQKAPDDLAALVKNRISEHQAAEAKRLEAERERIRAEEAAKVQRQQFEEAERLKREQQARDFEAAEAQRRADAQAAAAIAAAATTNAHSGSMPETSGLCASSEAKSAQASPSGSGMAVRAVKSTARSVEQPTLNLGTINERLGFTVKSTLLEELGFPAHIDRAARLYRESQFGEICEALVRHIESVRAESALAA